MKMTPWRVGLWATLLIAILALAPAVALAAPTPHVTMSDIKARGANGLRALELMTSGVRTAAASETISGTCSKVGTWAADANITATAFQYDPVQTAWSAAYFSDVATDGTYSMDVAPGQFKVGFIDGARVYKDTFYDNNVLAISAATTITVATDTPVAGVNATMVPNPVNMVEGDVHFSGASPAGQPVGVSVYQVDTTAGSPTLGQWVQYFSEKTDNAGHYRVHLLQNGPTRMAFNDFNDVFAPIDYLNSTDISTATTVTVVTDTPATGLDVTMTVQPSTRCGGSDPYGTAIALSQSRFDDGFGGTVTLCGDNAMADSLAAGPYALAQDGPLLFTDGTTIPDEVRAEIERLAPMQVVILGGAARVTVDVENELRDMGVPVVRRVWGASRYDTAAQVAQELVNSGLAGTDAGLGIGVANGSRFVDAVAGSPVAAANARPMLFVQKDAIPAATQNFIDRNAPVDTLVFGGTGVVDDTVAGDLPSAIRLGGADRYDTAARVAAYGIDTLGMQPRIVGLACGGDSMLCNGLAASPILGARNQVMLLTNPSSLNPFAGTFLTNRAGTIARISCVGDTSNVDDSTFAAAKTAAGIAP